LAGPDYPLCRLYHGRGPPSQGAPADQLSNFYHALGKKCTATDKKILASRTRKGPPPYVGMGPLNGYSSPADWGGGVCAYLLRVQLFVSTCNGRSHLALQYHFDDCKAWLVRFPFKTRYIRIAGFSFHTCPQSVCIAYATTAEASLIM